MTRKAPHSPSKNETRGRTKAGRPKARRSGASAPEPVPDDLRGDADPAGLAGGGARVIRRYGNRRLYDARLRRCVTMEEIGGFVRSGEEVRVIDADTEADITKRILVQLILEEQNRAQLELLPVSLLRALLGVRDGGASGWLEQYLKTGAEWLERAAKQATPLMSGWTWPVPGAGGIPGFGFPGAMPGGIPGFGAAQGPVPPAPPPPMSNTPPTAPAGAAPSPHTSVGQTHKEPPAAEPRAAAASDEAADLKRRLDEMQRQLADLAGLAARARRR